eukprot:scaffold4390_cov108-Isochrysis_galbana.AAC.7
MRGARTAHSASPGAHDCRSSAAALHDCCFAFRGTRPPPPPARTPERRYEVTYITDHDPTKKPSTRANIIAEMEVRRARTPSGGLRLRCPAPSREIDRTGRASQG